VSALANALKLLIVDEETRRRLGAHARARYEAEFAHERMLDHVELLYRDLVNECMLEKVRP
jgi:glycosyltransferase involved in cell wall biosynthesis